MSNYFPQDLCWNWNLTLVLSHYDKRFTGFCKTLQLGQKQRKSTLHTWLCTRVYCRIRERERERGTHVSAPTLSLQGPFITILGYLCLHTPIRQRRTLMSPPHPYHSARDLNELYPNSSAVLTRSICLLPLSVSGCALIRRQIWMHAPCATRERVFILPISATNHLDWAIKNYNPLPFVRACVYIMCDWARTLYMYGAKCFEC